MRYGIGLDQKMQSYIEFSNVMNPKLTEAEESRLEESFQLMDWGQDFVSIGEALINADPESLSPSVQKELTEKYLKNYEAIHNALCRAYETIGKLSAKKYAR